MKSWELDAELMVLIEDLKKEGVKSKRYSFVHNQLRRNGKLVVGPDEQLRKDIMKMWYDSPTGGHSGIDHTYIRINALFYRRGMKEDVQTLVKKCDVCQRHKYETVPYLGLLQPLKLPSLAWSSISMDFIEGLPKAKGKTGYGWW